MDRDAEARRWHGYLAMLAHAQLDPAARGRIDLEGVVQQSVLEALQKRQAFQGGPAQELAWLRRILANNLADLFRKLRSAKRDAGRERRLETALERSSARLEAWLAADQSSPSERAARNEQVLRLAEALARLPEAQREALVLQHWHGWSLAQIAEHLGRSRAAVAGLIKRGLQGLREELQPPG
jgi:RNA polymerase sigma-70 factor (ECF subfamily)